MLRWTAAGLVAALVLALGALPASGQGAPADGPSSLATDDDAGDTSGPLPAEGAGHLDIVHAEAAANERGLDFLVTVASLQADAPDQFGWELWLAFEYRGSRFDAVLVPTSTTADPPDEVDRILFGDLAADLWRMDDATQLGDFPSAVDIAARTFNGTVPWDLVLALDGTAASPGEPVRIVEAGSAWTPLLLGTPHNPFPASGTGAEAFVTGDRAAFPDGSFLGVPGAIGDLSLATPLPTRFSNGEATTMHWPIEVANHGTRDLDVRLDLSAAGAEARAPPGVRLAGGQSKVVNVYVTLPFAHEHGTQRTFLLTADSGAGDRATLRLGVDYPAIAQPAGHHPDLYLHASVQTLAGTLPVFGSQWMNTATEDDRANADEVGGNQGVCPDATPQPLGGSLEWGTLWVFGLDPGLRMGLDGRPGDLASLDVELVGAAAMPPGRLHGRLLLDSQRGDDGDFSLFETNATTQATAAVPATPGPTRQAVKLDLPMPPELDLVPPSRAENLLLALLFCLDAPPPGGFAVSTAASLATFVDAQPYSLASGGQLRLPLEEYHDAVDLAGASQGLALTVADPVRRAAPGATLLWQPALDVAEASAPAGAQLSVRLFGNAAPQARLLGEATVPARDTTLGVVLTVPDAPTGTVLDLLVDVTDEADPARSAGLRLSVLVDPAGTDDDSEKVAGLSATPKESPGPSTAALLAGLGVAAAAVAGRRRRRQ